MEEFGIPRRGAGTEAISCSCKSEQTRQYGFGTLSRRRNPYAIGLAHPSGSLQLGISVDLCPTGHRPRRLSRGAAEPVRYQSSSGRQGAGVTEARVHGTPLVDGLLRCHPRDRNCSLTQESTDAATSGRGGDRFADGMAGPAAASAMAHNRGNPCELGLAAVGCSGRLAKGRKRTAATGGLEGGWGERISVG